MTLKSLLKAIVLPAILLLCTQLSFAQERVVSGKVTDVKDGSPVVGASVVAKGSTRGTSTGADGSFRLTVGNDVSTLVITSVGFGRQEVSISGKDNVDVNLSATNQDLNAVVVVGYGSARKRDVTGSVTQVKASEFNTGNITNPLQQLAGKAAGVVVTQAGGDPNGGISVRVRGLTSLIAGGDPLYVVDGIVGADINGVSPSDIETVDILKDASASAIYGARGANGVVIINTKRGRSGKTAVEYNVYVASDVISKTLPVLDGPSFKAAYLAEGNNPAGLLDKGGNTDWQKEITRVGITQNHSLAFSGGSPKFNYRASVNYIDQQGIIYNSDRKYLNGRLQINQKFLNDKGSAQFIMAYTNQRKNFVDYSNPQENPFTYALNYSPLLPVLNSKGDYFQLPTFSYQNPLAFIKQITNQGDENLFNGSYKIDYELFKGFSLSTFGAIGKYNNTYGRYDPTNSFVGGAAFNSDGELVIPGRGNARRSTAFGTSYIMNFLANYKTKFANDHSIDILAGYEYSDFINEGFGATTSGFISDALLFNNLGSFNPTSLSDISAFSSKSGFSFASFFGRVAYSYKNKYQLTLNARADGSSKFGKNNKWGVFPSFAAAWAASEEDFLKDVSWLNNLKVRVGYGVTGNSEPIGPYRSLTLYGPQGRYYFDGQFLTGFGPNQLENPDLRWEKRSMFNVGIDFSILSNKISGSIEMYSSDTKDMLYEYGVPSPPLPFDRVFANVGNMNNKGFDLNINYNVVNNSKLKWTTGIVFSTVKNKITKLNGEITLLGQKFDLNTPKVGWGTANGQGLNQTVSFLQVGHSFGSFLLRRFQGVNPAGDQVFEINDPADDNNRWIDPWNKFTFGWSNQLAFGNFDAAIQFRGQYGGQAFNNTYLNFANVNRLRNNSNVHEDAITNGIKDPAKTSDFWVQSTSFLRLESMAIGYTFNTNMKNLKRLRLYVAGNNLFVLTNYKGYDPEVRVSGRQAYIDNLDFYPRTRSLSIGLNVNFE
jgi:TonB-dependent starch-binding outer membrane protein SusC